MGVFLKTEDEIDLMRRANRLVGATLAEVGRHIKPGVTTLQLDHIAEEFIRSHGARPTFKNFPNPVGGPFPGSVCTSVNYMVVHGIPRPTRVLKEGDIISVDCGCELDGWNGDSCYTFCVGEVSPEVQRLLRVTKECLLLGIKAAQPGHHVGDIGAVIQQHAEEAGFGVVRELTGHGIGREMHENPPIPNYGTPGSGLMLKEGMTIAIEPMITMGGREVWLLPDKWGIITRDGKPAAHYEHTIAIRRSGAEILSTFEEIEHSQKINS